MKKIKDQARQGDVLLLPENSVPTTAKKLKPENGKVILAHGEVTGHHHAIESDKADWWKDADSSDTFVAPKRGAKLEHQEHGAIALRPVVRRVRKQRMFHMGLVKRVVD
jgi:hypothetical protein